LGSERQRLGPAEHGFGVKILPLASKRWTFEFGAIAADARQGEIE